MPDDTSSLTSERVRPVRLLRYITVLYKEFAVWIRTHKGAWVAGRATYLGEFGFAYTTKTEIRCGKSVGPIVTRRGELAGVVSHGTTAPDGKGFFASSAPLIPLALPA